MLNKAELLSGLCLLMLESSETSARDAASCKKYKCVQLHNRNVFKWTSSSRHPVLRCSCSHGHHSKMLSLYFILLVLLFRENWGNLNNTVQPNIMSLLCKTETGAFKERRCFCCVVTDSPEGALSHSWRLHFWMLSGCGWWSHWAWSTSSSVSAFVFTHLMRRRCTPPPQDAEHCRENNTLPWAGTCCRKNVFYVMISNTSWLLKLNNAIASLSWWCNPLFLPGSVFQSLLAVDK